MTARKLGTLAGLLVAFAGALQLAGCNCGSNGDDDEGQEGGGTTLLFGSSEDGNTFDPSTTLESTSTSSDPASTSQASGETEGGNEPIGSPCAASAECESGVCATWYEDNKHGNFGCEETCIQLMDESRWCRDADACCDQEAECSPRGYCLLPGSGTFGESGGSDSSTGESSTGDTETSTSE